MGNPLLKICGITQVETLERIKKDKLHVDWLGFIFAYGKRLVPPDSWGELSSHVPPTSKTVGVFVNPDMERVREIMQKAPLDLIQLHGQETPEFCQEIKGEFGCQIIKVIGMTEDGEAKLQVEPYQGAVDYILLDTMTKTQAGGTGKTFAWESIPAFQAKCRQNGLPLLVAGGLHAGNIEELLLAYEPYGVDLSSGVETNGIKDMEKIRKVIKVIERMKDCEAHRN